jgi:hypothetical protein
MKVNKPKTLKRLLKEQIETFGDDRNSMTFGLPDWVTGLVREAYAEGKKSGVVQENRRLRNKLDKVTRWVGKWPMPRTR